MKLVTFHLSAILLLAICACAGGTDLTVSESLSGKSFDCSPLNGRYPRLFVDSISFGFDNGWNGTATVLNERGCSPKDIVFHHGNGHNEFGRISFGKGANNSLLVLNNPIGGDKLLSMTVVNNADNMDSIKNVSTWKRYDLSKLSPFRSPCNYFVSLTDSTALVAGCLWDAPQNIFAILNYKSQIVTPLDFWPEKDVDMSDRNFGKCAMFTENCELFGNGKGHFLYHFIDDGRFAFIFSIEGNKVNVIKELYYVLPEYEINKDKNAYRTIKKAPGMLSYANNHNIYLLHQIYSSELIDITEYYKTKFEYDNILEIYDWNGNKKKTIKLDTNKKCNSMIVSDDNKTLYVCQDDDNDEMKMLSYDLDMQK